MGGSDRTQKVTVSPPTREAWIEIELYRRYPLACLSPPTREAWIEMFLWGRKSGYWIVASHPGGVD